MSDYPPQIPRVGERQSLGIRAGNRRRKRVTIGGGYRRTGRLGRGWRMRLLVGTKGASFSITGEAYNRVPYTVFVQGPRPGAPRSRQTDVMRARGWQSVTPEAAAEWRRWRPRIVRILTQQDGRVRRRTLRV